MNYSRVNLAEVINKYLAGASVQALASEYRTSPRVLKRRFTRAGIRLRSGAESRAMHAEAQRLSKGYPEAEIVKAYTEGMPLCECASHFKHHYKTIERILTAHGIKLRGVSAARLMYYASLTKERLIELTSSARAQRSRNCREREANMRLDGRPSPSRRDYPYLGEFAHE